MDRLSIEKGMIKNMIEKTGKPIEEWIKIIKEKYFLTWRNSKVFKRTKLINSWICQFNCMEVKIIINNSARLLFIFLQFN